MSGDLTRIQLAVARKRDDRCAAPQRLRSRSAR